MEPLTLLGPPWNQGPGTGPGFWSPVTAAERGVTAPISHRSSGAEMGLILPSTTPPCSQDPKQGDASFLGTPS